MRRSCTGSSCLAGRCDRTVADTRLLLGVHQSHHTTVVDTPLYRCTVVHHSVVTPHHCSWVDTPLYSGRTPNTRRQALSQATPLWLSTICWTSPPWCKAYTHQNICRRTRPLIQSYPKNTPLLWVRWPGRWVLLWVIHSQVSQLTSLQEGRGTWLDTCHVPQLWGIISYTSK